MALGQENQLFPRENKKNHQEGFFGCFGFPRKKLVFLPKTIFFLEKTKKTIFLESGRIVSQKMFFFGCFGFP